MSHERSLDWDHANVEGGILNVPLTGEPNQLWQHVASKIVSRHESEVRGQTWKSVLVTGDGFFVGGFDPDNVHGLQLYLAEIVDATNREVPSERQRRADAAAAEEQAARDAEVRDADLTQRFRNPPT